MDLFKDPILSSVCVCEGRSGRSEGASGYTELKTKNPHVNVGNKSTQVSFTQLLGNKLRLYNAQGGVGLAMSLRAVFQAPLR